MCVYICILIIRIYAYSFVRASNLRWPELLARVREPPASGVQTVNLASRVPRDDFEHYSGQRVCIEQSGCTGYIFSFLVCDRLFTFLIALIYLLTSFYKFSSRSFGIDIG
jgi:hypothetical protein